MGRLIWENNQRYNLLSIKHAPADTLFVVKIQPFADIFARASFFRYDIDTVNLTDSYRCMGIRQEDLRKNV